MLFPIDEVIKTPHVDAFDPQGTIVNKIEYHGSWGRSEFVDQTVSNAGFSLSTRAVFLRNLAQ